MNQKKGKKLKVLIVDQVGANRQVVKSILEPYGHQVVEAFDGHDAVTRMTQDVDVALVDTMM